MTDHILILIMLDDYRYIKLDNKLYSDQEWDECLAKADEKYRGMMVFNNLFPSKN